MTRALFIIDPQKDFIDDPEFMGSLAVPGAFEDMKRLAQYIDNEDFNSIVVTLDTHDKMHIANPMWWVDEEGNNPNQFTLITVEDVVSGKWRASQEDKVKSSIEYVKKLEAAGKYKLCIWPYHCIEGTEGHKIVEVVANAIQNWEKRTGHKAVYVLKGQNPNTEMYSGLKAEVVIPEAPETEINQDLIDSLYEFDVVELAGEAKSHCTASTGYDLIAGFEEISKNAARKIIILENCMSSVPGFEEAGDLFVENAKKAGCRVTQVREIVVKKPKFGK